MRELELISEDQMIASFLQGEFYSKRFGSYIAYLLNLYGKEKSIIFSPDFSKSQDNELRKALLDYRGYRKRTRLFAGFPIDDIDWKKFELNLFDLQKLFVLAQPKWVSYSYGTRKIVDVLQYYSANPNMDEAEHIEQCVKSIRKGKSFSDVILVGKDLSNLVILEGHIRILAYLINCDSEIKVNSIVGLSDKISSWEFYKL